MTEPRDSGHHTKVHSENPDQGVGGPRAAAGRATYREEFQRDYGPDLDESLDGTESGPAF
jgi:hypothetical protein